MTALRLYHVSTIQYWFLEILNSLIVKSILTLCMFPILIFVWILLKKDSKHFSYKHIFSSIKPNIRAL